MMKYIKAGLSAIAIYFIILVVASGLIGFLAQFLSDTSYLDAVWAVLTVLNSIALKIGAAIVIIALAIAAIVYLAAYIEELFKEEKPDVEIKQLKTYREAYGCGRCSKQFNCDDARYTANKCPLGTKV